MNLKFPRTIITQRKSKTAPDSAFSVTYEYAWQNRSKGTTENNIIQVNTISANSCTWEGSISFFPHKMEVKQKMKVIDLTCPSCGTSVIQSKCTSCRKKTIRSYKCQKCGVDVPNPEYGDP